MTLYHRLTWPLWLLRQPRYLRHLLHRRCGWCFSEGSRAGFLAAAAEASRLQAERDRIWREVGVDPDRLEEYVRRAA